MFWTPQRRVLLILYAIATVVVITTIMRPDYFVVNIIAATIGVLVGDWIQEKIGGYDK